MGHSQYDDPAASAAWNAGKKVGTKRPLTHKQNWAVRFILDRERRIRDRVTCHWFVIERRIEPRRVLRGIARW